MLASYGSYARHLYSGLMLWVLWFFHVKVLIFWITATALLLLDYHGLNQHVNGVHALILSLQVINFASEPLEMVLWTYHLLEPWLYLTLQALKAVMWTVFIPIGIVIIRGASIRWAWVDNALFAVLGYTALWFYASLVYAIYVFMRSIKKSGYEPPVEDDTKGWRRGRKSPEKTKTDSQAHMVPSQSS